MDRIQKKLRRRSIPEAAAAILSPQQNLIRDPAYRTIATFSDGTRTREIIEKKLVGVPDITEPMPEGFGMYAR